MYRVTSTLAGPWRPICPAQTVAKGIDVRDNRHYPSYVTAPTRHPETSLTSTDTVNRCFFAAYYREADKVPGRRDRDTTGLRPHVTTGFEHLADAERFLADLRARFAKFGLELHPDKTRLIEFGRYADRARAARGVGKPETFDFLGFTHICGKTKTGRFWLRRKTISKRMRAKLAEVKDQLKGPTLGSVSPAPNWAVVPGQRCTGD
jgi:hypothetical protein